MLESGVECKGDAEERYCFPTLDQLALTWSLFVLGFGTLCQGLKARGGACWRWCGVTRFSVLRFQDAGSASGIQWYLMVFGGAGRSKKLLGAKGIATRNKDATRGSWPYY